MARLLRLCHSSVHWSHFYCCLYVVGWLAHMNWIHFLKSYFLPHNLTLWGDLSITRQPVQWWSGQNLLRCPWATGIGLTIYVKASVLVWLVLCWQCCTWTKSKIYCTYVEKVTGKFRLKQEYYTFSLYTCIISTSYTFFIFKQQRSCHPFWRATCGRYVWK